MYVQYTQFWSYEQCIVEKAIIKISMDKTFIEQQKNLAKQRLEEFGEKKGQEKQATATVYEYMLSLLNSENFTDAEREDLRKLALEFGYSEDTDFSKWTPTFPTSEKVE